MIFNFYQVLECVIEIAFLKRAKYNDEKRLTSIFLLSDFHRKFLKRIGWAIKFHEEDGVFTGRN